MTRLDDADGHVVVINTFTVDPTKAEELLRVLVEGTEQVVSKRRGFVSANWHMAEDKRHVTNYAQWRDRGALAAMLADPEVRGHLLRAGALIHRVDPIVYQLRRTFSTPEGPASESQHTKEISHD